MIFIELLVASTIMKFIVGFGLLCVYTVPGIVWSAYEIRKEKRNRAKLIRQGSISGIL